MRLVVAGGGPVGRALAEALGAAGHQVATWRRRLGVDHAIDDGADAVVVAVTDHAIAEVAAQLVAERVATSGTVLLHTAGAVSPEDAFAGVRDAVGGVGLMHPLRAFAGAADDGDLRGTVFAVAGDAAAQAVAVGLVESVGGRPLPLSSRALPRYHAAAVLVANHTLALVEAGVALLGAEGLERRAAEQALAGLLATAAANVDALGLPAALTGPIARGDEAAVARHLAALPPSALPLYRATALATVALARARAGADEAALDRIERLLAGA